MTDRTDRYGRVITNQGDNTWSVDGITIAADSFADALMSLNAMAPAGWQEPESQPELT